jgi:hypothetical protein
VEDVPASRKFKGLRWQPSLTAAFDPKSFFAALATILVAAWVLLALVIAGTVTISLAISLMMRGVR